MFSSVLLCVCCIGYGTTVVYGAEDGGSAAQDDAMALVQYAIRSTDVDAPKSATNLSKSGSRYYGVPVDIETDSYGYKTGYPLITTDHKKCFLSKSSLFTAAGYNFKFKEPLGVLQRELLQIDPSCTTCQEALQWTLADRKIHLAPGTDLQKKCKACYDAWSDRSGKGSLTRDQNKAVFEEQQPYMNDLASLLMSRGVSLYLDFMDTTAEGVIGDYRTNGKEWPQEVILGVTEQLRRSVERTDIFLHWEGAGGEYCMIEKAAAWVAGKGVQHFKFPPLGDKYETIDALHPSFLSFGGINPQICRRDVYDNSKFAERVCEACGGKNCGSICP